MASLLMMNQGTTINVSLPRKFRKLANATVAGEHYRSASEVVRVALCLLGEREANERSRLAQLRKQVKRGLAQARRGDLHDGERFFASLNASGHSSFTGGHSSLF
jgi:putative addiction module CopG family antidote